MNMAGVCWKEKMVERCKQTLPPITDKDLEIETVKIPRPIPRLNNYHNYTIDKLLAEETEEIQLQQQQKNDENINITELKEIVQSLTRENKNLKQENKTFLKVVELMHKKDDIDTNKIEQTVQKKFIRMQSKQIQIQGALVKQTKLKQKLN